MSVYAGSHLAQWRSMLAGSASGAGGVVVSLGPPADLSVTNVKAFPFLAKGDGVTNDTAAIQSAIDFVLALPTGGTVYVPRGTYCVTSLDLHDESVVAPATSFRIMGDGQYASVIEGTLNGAILIDAIGRSYLSLEHLRLTTDGTAVYQTGLLLARRDGGAEICRSNTFRNVTVWGEFSVAAVVSIASEINNWNACELVNDSAINNYCSFFTGHGNSIAAVTSTHGDILESNANTYNVMTQVTFYAPYVNATPIIMHRGGQYTMVACSVQCDTQTGTGVRCVTYIDDGGGPGGGFLGAVTWIGTLWEVRQATVHYFQTETVALGHYQNITDTNGTYVIAGPAAANVVMGMNGTPAVLIQCAVGGIRYYGGIGSTLAIDVDYVFGCHLDIWSAAFPTTITINEQRSSSFLRAQTIVAPASAVDDPTYGVTVSEVVDPSGSSHHHDPWYLPVDSFTPGRVPYYPVSDVLTDGAMEVWTSATNLTHWSETLTGTSTVNREPTEKHGGTYACRLDVDALDSDVMIAEAVTLAVGASYKVTIWYKTAAGKVAGFILRDSGSHVYLHADGSWGAELGVTLPTATTWTKFEILLATHPDYTSYALLIGAGANWLGAASSSVYLDDVSITRTGIGDSPIAFDGSADLATLIAPTLRTSGIDGTGAPVAYIAHPDYPTTWRHRLSASQSSIAANCWLTWALTTGASSYLDVLKLDATGAAWILGPLVTTVDGAVVQAQRTGVTTLTDATATPIFTVTMADGARAAGEVAYTVEVTNAGGDNDIYTGAFRFAAQRKGSTVTCAIGAIGTGLVTKSHGGADLTVVATAEVGTGTNVIFKLNADTSLTPTTFKAHWSLKMLKGHGEVTG